MKIKIIYTVLIILAGIVIALCMHSTFDNDQIEETVSDNASENWKQEINYNALADISGNNTIRAEKILICVLDDLRPDYSFSYITDPIDREEYYLERLFYIFDNGAVYGTNEIVLYKTYGLNSVHRNEPSMIRYYMKFDNDMWEHFTHWVYLGRMSSEDLEQLKILCINNDMSKMYDYDDYYEEDFNHRDHIIRGQNDRIARYYKDFDGAGITFYTKISEDEPVRIFQTDRSGGGFSSGSNTADIIDVITNSVFYEEWKQWKGETEHLYYEANGMEYPPEEEKAWHQPYRTKDGVVY